MQVMSNEYNSIAQNDNARYYAVVKYNNEELNIDLQDFDYKGMINADDDITIGNTCSASVSFSLYNPDIVLTNKEIEIKQGLLVNGKIESLRMGFFTIQKPTSDGEVTEYVGYDRMIKAEKTYSSKLKFPAKTQDIMNEIASALGIVFATKLPKSYSISERPSGYTYREIIGFIAAMYGTNAIINRDGQLEFKWYTNVNYIIDGGRYYENGIEIDSENDYILQKITCVVAKNNETTTLTSGTGTQGISINNPLMTQSILNSIYDNIKSFTFRAMSVKFLGDFRIDLGDIITVKQNGKKYSVPVMQIEHQCDGGVITKITSVAKTEDEQEIDTSGPSTKAMNRYYAELVTINKALINKLDVDTAKITYATINNLDVVNEKVENLTAIAITTDNLVANVAKISTLTADSAIIANIKAVGINSTYINSQVAKLGYITSEKADLNYADIKLANIEIADIGKFFANCGLITSAVIKDGHITGYLDAVEINANNITAGTLTTDRLVIRGSDKSLIYELNNITGALQSKNVDTLNGEIITKRTIAADKIIAESITSKEIASDTITTDKLNVNDIFSNNAVITKLTTQDAFINNIATNEIIIRGILSNLEVGATNLLVGSTIYTEDNKLSLTATKDDFIKTFGNIYVDLEKDETYTFNCKTDGIYGINGDTVEVFFLKDRAYTTFFRPSSLPYTFNCTESGRYYLRVDVNKKGSTHSFWNFQIEKGNVATDWKPSNYDTETQIADTQDWINNKGINLYNMVLKWTGNAISDTTTINGGWISTNTITADKLAISTEGFVKDPMFANWNSSLPDGFIDWNSSFANGKVRKIVENNANLIQITASATESTGLGSNGNSASTTSLFSYKLSLDGLKYICVEIKFRLTNGVNPSGAGLFLDVYGFNASNALVSKRIVCKLSDLGKKLTNNVWYTYRKIIKLNDEISVCKLNSLSAYLFCNYSELGTLTAKTIQFASLNVYRATEQDYLTQSWTSGTYINGNALLTGSVTADSIATDAIKSKNYNDGSMGSEKLGAYFNLADGTMTTPYLSWDKRGQLKCSSADISGKVTASSGKIGNWNIQMSVTNRIGSSGMLYSAINHTDSQGYGEQYLVHLAPINIYDALNDTWVLAAYHYNMPDKKTAIANWFLTYGGEFYTIGRHRCMGSTYPQIFGNGAVLQLSQTSDASTGVVIENTTFRPSGNATMTLGTNRHRWNNLYISASAIVTSDKNKKNSIEDLDDDITKELIMGLIPKSYKYDDGTSGRTHYGLIAQDVEELLERLGIDTKDFAGFIKSPNVKEYETNKLDDDGNVILDEGGNPQKEFVREVIEGEYDYALRYEEFISPLIKVVQMQQKMIEDLKADIQRLPS